MKTYVRIFMTISRRIILTMSNVQDKVVEKIKTHIMFNYLFFQKSCPLWNYVEKYSRAEQATDDNMAHVHCMLGN